MGPLLFGAAKIYAVHAQLGWPVESTTLTRAEDVNSFVEMLMLSFAGQGEVEPFARGS